MRKWERSLQKVMGRTRERNTSQEVYDIIRG